MWCERGKRKNNGNMVWTAKWGGNPTNNKRYLRARLNNRYIGVFGKDMSDDDFVMLMDETGKWHSKV